MNYTYRYKNPIFNGKCIPYAVVGYEYLKGQKCITNISVKRYKINFDNDYDVYSPHHYFIEFKINNEPYILDNDWYYRKHHYKQNFKPKNIEKLKACQIKEIINEYKNDCIYNLIQKDVITHINNNFK
jgi:hypothetical protein